MASMKSEESVKLKNSVNRKSCYLFESWSNSCAWLSEPCLS